MIHRAPLATRKAPQARCEYDPNARRVELPANASPFQYAHEYAHKLQHETGTRAWRVERKVHHLPILSRLARLWVEIEANRMALRALQHAGRCDRHARADARRSVCSYIRAIFPA